MEREKILVITTTNFRNESRVLKECISLKKDGNNVTIVALHEEPLKEFEKVGTTQVHRIKLKSRSWPKHLLFQLLKYIEFIYKVVKLYAKNKHVVHCHDFSSLPIGMVIKKMYNKNIKIVYDAHEYETEINGLKGGRKKLTKIVEKKLIKYVDKVITVSDSIANEYVRLYAIDKPAVVLNTPPFVIFINKTDVFRNTFNIANEQIIFLYQGGLDHDRGIEIILDAFIKLSNKTHPLNGKAAMVFMGYGPLEDLVYKAAHKYDNIYFHPAVPPDVLLNYTGSADFGILFYENTCLNHYYCSPNKIFEYVMAELPVIVSDLYEMKRFVSQNKIGCVSKENTSDGLITAIGEVMNMNYQELKNNVKNLKTVYNWEEQEKILLNIYKEL